MKLTRVLNQPVWRLASDKVEAQVTQLGGHLGPVTFRLGRRIISPLATAPWLQEPLPKGTPALLKVLRGDFFCMPFGGNSSAYQGEKHPPHGETANARWSLTDSVGVHSATWTLRTKIRPGRIVKKIFLREGETAIYQRHELHGMAGPMNLGHHAILKFPEREGSGLISTSGFAFGQVYPGTFEDPGAGGYSSLKTGAHFSQLQKVARVDGGVADLSRYPARRGYEDLVMLISKTNGPFAWTAVAFPRERYVWFALKDPLVLRQTVFWISNRGRHYAPWNGRHGPVMGLEEVTSHFHDGLAESARSNALTRRGIPTCLSLSPKKTTVINYIMAVAEIPESFGHVKNIRPGKNGVTLVSANKKRVDVPLDWEFLHQK
jgi:hypothetical protein